ncbi:MAG: hypothetical protein H0A75_03015 [Candidatus Methanofishera endochildressiae]|uniref:Uncharacterized protein n=1 Tax=Candidatus Methanofishera endochildressiae TaxID=2738884 RepID=A0A7Z0MP02_9GAMM|nr:hypothetical protein [Candidatus Methanofishera endochildressiae]
MAWIINGEPVADPLIRLAALPTLDRCPAVYRGTPSFSPSGCVGMFIFIGGWALILLGFFPPPFFLGFGDHKLIILVMFFGSTDK